ncbi:uncharacterized protein LOC128092285 [Culex pipiens pallens]|uniref:uncharacterized protein LOC128092285 n=1 Tax=Culex pipiens pallens TaxID=42434 RepID=UPI0022AA9974|nr:uncharacterized protein LOC128092285 [Culex pipiens pallens]
MSQRNLTELFFMLRNNVLYSKNIYSDTANLQTVGLLDRQSGESSNFIEQPTWICKYDEAQYLLSKIKSRVNDLLRVQNSTARSVLSESREDELKVGISYQVVQHGVNI